MQSKGYVVVEVWIIQAFLLSSAHWKPEIVKSINLVVCFSTFYTDWPALEGFKNKMDVLRMTSAFDVTQAQGK